MTVNEILEATGGKLLFGTSSDVVTGISTDSRTVQKGNLFFALSGENHDGHRFMDEVYRKGAVAAIVQKPLRRRFFKNVIRVPDTLTALGDLAHHWRKKFPIPVVAITGSNGKTTTKELIASLLATRYRVLKTEGNFNNLIGLPLTLFRLDASAEIAVLEMGMNHLGEIKRLSQIAAPQVGLITNIARAHLGEVGSLLQITHAKGELLEALPQNGMALLNRDDPSFSQLKAMPSCPVITFGEHKESTIRLSSVKRKDLRSLSFLVDLRGKRVSFQLRAVGRHNVTNALAALAVADHLGIPVSKMKEGLQHFNTNSKRMELISLSHKKDLLNDCYNANPDSMKASLDFMKETGKKRRRVAILGEMLELGKYAPTCHREIGTEAGKAGIDLLIAIGPHSQQMIQGAKKEGVRKTFSFKTAELAIPTVRQEMRPGDLILVKGSRGIKMEQITESLKEVHNAL